jgi:nitroreductase
MKGESHRRSFLRQSAVLGGGLTILSPETKSALGAEPSSTPPAKTTSVPNETLETIRTLRTVHGNFLDRPLPESDLDAILEATVRAANASNMQSYSIVVVKDRKLMKDVCTYQGGCMLLYCVDFNRVRASAKHLGYSYFPDNMEAFVTATVNVGLAVQTAAIAARSLGIDYLITNGIHRGDMERVWKLLNLPTEYCFPFIAMVLGYPTEEPAHLRGRLNGPGIIHHEKYHGVTKDEVEDILHQYDDPERHLALIDGWKDRGHAHYLNWFFTEWIGGSKPTRQETPMLRFLKRSGFVELQKI